MRYLAAQFVEEYRKGKSDRLLKVLFPDRVDRIEQVRVLREIEEAAVKTVVAIMKRDIATLTPFPVDTAKQRAEKEALAREHAQQVSDWESQARSEARGGSNWSHNWSLKTHSFRGGSALGQLKSISIGGWRGN
jgi:hypothetical protein